MRLISQDGRGDMPYENFIFRACGGDIVASRDILTNEKQIVARYSTEAKALKVMEMLRNAYSRFTNTYNIIFKFPTDEDVEV